MCNTETQFYQKNKNTTEFWRLRWPPFLVHGHEVENKQLVVVVVVVENAYESAVFD